MSTLVLTILLSAGLVPLLQRDLRRAVERRRLRQRFGFQFTHLAPAFAAMSVALSGLGTTMVKAAANFETTMDKMRSAMLAARPASPFAANTLAATLTGTPVVQSYLAVRAPTPVEWARRFIRHGMADVLDWLGEDVGPAPDDPVPTSYVMNDGRGVTILAHPAVAARMRAGSAVIR